MESNKAIIYDDTCPMCAWYTNAFVKAGLLDEKNRLCFSMLPDEDLIHRIDHNKSRDEIPLVDLNGGSTLYGLDSLSYLLGVRYKIVPKVLKIKPIRWFFQRLYKVVSYNRRVIAGVSKSSNGFDCTPNFNWEYRILYAAFATFTGISLILAAFFSFHFFLPAILVTFGIFATALIVFKRSGLVFAGHFSTILLVAGLVSVPAIWLPVISPILAWVAIIITGRQIFFRIKCI